MGKKLFNVNQKYGFLPPDIKGIDSLTELALDVRWSWNHATDELWQQLDAELWEQTHNPLIVLQTVSREELERQLANPAFQLKISQYKKSRQQDNLSAAWFQQKYPKAPLTSVAYFSMEFMLSEALPIYVGGLGNVAGDQLKSASDLGVPVTAVGLLYQQGYFRQEIDQSGWQQAQFPYNDPGQLPVTPLRLANGEWLRLKIWLSGYPVWLRTWQVQVGRLRLYLLDSNDAANLPVHRGITAEVYGGGSDTRIKQEIILGMGGWRLLRALGIKPEVCHMNEGHAAFVVLERARDLVKEQRISFEEAMAITRAGNLFTTHTAVAAGFDQFSPQLMEQFLGEYASNELGIDFNELMALGRRDPNNTSEGFNMAYLAIHGSGAVNGVSRLHGVVSRHLFESIFPRWPTNEVPVGSVTNGVHMAGWDSEFADEIWTHSCGKDRWRGDLETVERDIYEVPDEKLWQLRNLCRNNLINYTRKRLANQLMASGRSPEIVDAAKQVFDPNALTLGFARRFVSYKRLDLLLHDQDRLVRLLTNAKYPVQLIIAGKAPPFDDSGKAIIQQWIQFIRQHNLYHRVVFLSDYDMRVAEQMVQGVDVWINTPRRPWEACGTSGMKILVNGGLNLSELDGWWAEAYSPEVGWAMGDLQEHGDDPGRDAEEAATLYNLLEQQVIPEFYERNQSGMPERWVERIRKSMATLTPRFSANRTVREYTEKYYLPAAANYTKRLARGGAIGKQIVSWKDNIKNKGGSVKFGGVQMEGIENGYLFRAGVWMNGIDPGEVLVQMYADGINGSATEKINMALDSVSADKGEHIYSVEIISKRPSTDYTARIIPNYEGVSVPLENNWILWQR